MPQPDHSALAIRIQQRMEDLPPLSPTVAKVLRIANNPDANATDLIQVIKLDPVLTGKVLRLINSPFFGIQNVTSVARALVVLGFNTVKNLALSSALAGIMHRDTNQDSDDLWIHSLSVGTSARSLARALEWPPEEQEAAFIGGLMHDLGKVLTTRFFQQEMRSVQLLVRKGISELQSEQEVLGATHVQIGGNLGRKWQFPLPLIASIEAHHAPLEEGVGSRESCLTCVANAMYYRLGVERGEPTNSTDHMIPEHAWEVLGIDEAGTIEALSDIPEEIDAAQSFLEA